MKPTFALDLNSDRVGLLHRTPKGWLSVGDAAFDAPDLAEAMDYLRKTALGLSPMGIATKIVIPNSQVLFTEVTASGRTREDKRKQIATALEGRTPYPVEDLVFDWSGKGAKVKVAVVARETLAEAEAFATEHRLNPVSFVAIPDEGTFVGEPWFGPTEASATILAEGETVDRDRDAIVMLHRDLPKADTPEPAVAAPAEAESGAETGSEPGAEMGLETGTETADAVPGPAPMAEPTPEAPPASADSAVLDDGDAPLPGLEEALAAVLMPDQPELMTSAPRSDASREFGAPAPFAPETAVPDPEVALEAERALNNPPPGPAPDAAPDAPAEADEAPFAHVTDTSAFSDVFDTTPERPIDKAAAPFDDDVPPTPPGAALVAFASRRAAGLEGSAASAPGRQAGAVPAPGRPDLTDVRPMPGSPLRNGSTKGFAGNVTAPSIPGLRKAKGKSPLSPSGQPLSVPPRPAAIAPPALNAKPLTKPGGTFGTKTPPRRRPRFLGMILTALLLVCLAIAAALSSFYVSSNTEADSGTVLVDATVPAGDDEMLADMQDPADVAPLAPEADLASDDVPSGAELAPEAELAAVPDLAPEPEPEPATEPDLALAQTDEPASVAPDTAEETLAADPLPTATPGQDVPGQDVPEQVVVAAPEPAPRTEVTTDVAAAQPLGEDQDEIFLAAMDTPPPAPQALALPPPVAIRDTPPAPQMQPPVFGTVYVFDARGLLRPTPEGILSPEGVMLIAGKPPVLPPSRSEAVVVAALAAAAVPAPADPLPDAAAGADGAANPVDAALDTAPVELAPPNPELEGFRPLPRPGGLVPAAAAPESDASLSASDSSGLAGFRPLARSGVVLAAASAQRPAETADLGAQASSLMAQGDAARAAASVAEAANPSVVAISRRPAERPRDLSRAVEAAVAAAVREPEPTQVAAAPTAILKPEEHYEIDEPELAAAPAPKIPTKAGVAKQATYSRAINLSKTNLIGVYGTQSRRYALIRQSNGRYKKVVVGDKLEGGTVQVITENEVRYQKSGRLYALQMPKT